MPLPQDQYDIGLLAASSVTTARFPSLYLRVPWNMVRLVCVCFYTAVALRIVSARTAFLFFKFFFKKNDLKTQKPAHPKTGRAPSCHREPLMGSAFMCFFYFFLN